MRDEGKTKEQLVRELAATRQRITELEAAETERKRVEQVLRRERREISEPVGGHQWIN